MKRQKKINIGVLTEVVSGASGARAPLEIAVQLARRGHEVTVYAYNYIEDEEMRRYLVKNKVHLTTINKPALSRYFAISTIFNKLRQKKHHILYFSGTPPFFIAGLLSQTPIVRMYQGTQFDAYLEKFLPDQKTSFFHLVINQILNCCIYLVDFMSFRLSNAVVAISQYAAHEGESLYQRKVSRVIYHGISELIPTPSARKNIPPTIRLLSVSRITPYKGFHLIIQALKNVHGPSKFILTVAGSQAKTYYVEYLQKLAGPLLKIVLTPPDKKLALLYSTSDIYVTADRYLYFGLPVAEAAQFGIPTVAMNFAAAHEVVAHGKSGYVAQNVQELSFYLEKLIKNSTLRKRMGLEAKSWIKRFGWKKTGREWEKVLIKYAHV